MATTEATTAPQPDLLADMDGESSPVTDQHPTSADPFAGHRGEGDDPFNSDGAQDTLSVPQDGQRDRRMSKEWDASKVPPSQFQRRKGSIFSTPGSRDGHTQGKDRDSGFHAKLKEKGWVKST
ncbi:hypothetical protein MMC25_004993 [Agyrium rufum]|nr:hypothetical protein [Agyrium rufum]